MNFSPMVKGSPDWHEKYNGDLQAVKEELDTKAGLDASGKVTPMPSAADVGAAPKSHTHTKSQISDFPAGLPPTGTAGGDLSGTFPNPTVKADAIGAKAMTITQASARANLASGDTLKTMLGKLMKWFADLGAVAWSGSYNDLANKPTSMTPTPHTHDDRYFTEAEVTSQLADKANTNHTHTAAQVGAVPSTGGEFTGLIRVTTADGETGVYGNGLKYMGTSMLGINGETGVRIRTPEAILATFTNDGVTVSKKITGLPDPAAASDAANKGYVDAGLAGKAAKSTSVAATLTAASWAGSAAPFTQTISVSGVTADASQVVEVGLSETATAAQREAARGAALSPAGKAAGTLAVTADGEKPAIDLPVTVVILG